MIRCMKEYRIDFDTKVGGFRSHTWYVRAFDREGALDEFWREREEDGLTAHPFHIRVKCMGVPERD